MRGVMRVVRGAVRMLRVFVPVQAVVGRLVLWNFLSAAVVLRGDLARCLGASMARDRSKRDPV